jgi:hypothetical protein
MPGLTHPKYEGESWEHQIWVQIVTTFCVALFRGNRDKYFYLPTRRKFPSLNGEILYFLSPDVEKMSISQWGDIISCQRAPYIFMPTSYVTSPEVEKIFISQWGDIIFEPMGLYIFTEIIFSGQKA